MATTTTTTKRVTTAAPAASAQEQARGVIVMHGDSGTLKTRTALTFPKPVVIQDAISRGATDAVRELAPGATVLSLASFDGWTDVVDRALATKADTLILDDWDAALERQIDEAEAAWSSQDKRGAYKGVYARIMPGLYKALLGFRFVVITLHSRKEQELIPGLALSENDDMGGTGARRRQLPMRAYVHPNLPEALERYITSVARVVAYTFNNGSPKALVSESANQQRRIAAKRRVQCADVVELARFVDIVTK